METWYIPYQTSALPPAQRVLALAPHPDDEIFGCGGVLALYAQLGVHIDVVVVTDGAGFSVDDERHHVRLTRQQETVQALQQLNIASVKFWDFPDRSLAGHEGLVQAVLDLLRDLAPQVVLAPSPQEIHPDHSGLARATIAAMARLTEPQPRPVLMQYEVGATLAANMLVDITPVWDRKKQAMHCFVSQLELQDYARHIEGLNTFRTYTLPREVKYAEAYRCIQWEDLGAEMSQPSPLAAMTVLEATDAQAEALQQQVLDLQRTQQQTSSELEALTAHAQELAKQNEAHAQLLHQVLSSNSWRITQPLRWAVSQFRRLFG
jgi:LmbE family N-acetylglucosaminyl deacetylase